MDTSDRDQQIYELRADGWSAIEIAEAMGLSRSQVHRILAVGNGHAVPERDDDGTEERVSAMDDARGSSDDFTPPFTVVGAEWVEWVNKGYDHAKTSLEPRYVDGAGRSVNALGLYRTLARLSAEHGYAYTDKIRADLKRQRAEQGLVMVNNGNGKVRRTEADSDYTGWHWEQT
jgi:hypothetical protein